MTEDQKELMKKCTKCKEEKPFSNFGARKDRGIGARKSACKSCETIFATNRRKENPEKAAAVAAKYRAKNPEKIKALFAAWYVANPEKVKKNSAAWYAANSDKAKADSKAYRESNPDIVKASQKAWRLANPERDRERKAEYYIANKDRVNAYSASWVAANPEAKRIHNQNDRAKRRSGSGILSKGLAGKLFKLQRGKCACCGLPLGDNYHLDHITPLSRGGSNEDSNIQLLTQRCNNQKHGKDPIDFMQSRGFLL